QQGKQGGTQGSHASCKADAAYPFFHACNLGFQRRRGRRALAGISKAGLALKDRSQLTRILKPELGRRVQWLMNSAMLRAPATVRVQGGGNKAVFFHDRFQAHNACTHRQRRLSFARLTANYLLSGEAADETRRFLYK